MIVQCRQFKFTFPRPTVVMGVVNVTPDSFSDGGKFFKPQAAIEHALELAAQGAEIIDIGGESTRPRAVPVPEDEELRRVLPVLEGLSGRLTVPISVDTMKAGVARAALEAGASIVNDVSAARPEPGMWKLLAETRAGYVCMHAQGPPPTMQDNPKYDDVVREVSEFFSERLAQLGSHGVAAEQIILDPGIGFGKSFEHNMQLLGGLKVLTELARPLLLGVSRKSFLGGHAGERLPAGLACACLAVEAGVRFIRTHDVAETVRALRMTEAILAKKREECG
jgi:dihydropteroate synthase